MSTQGQQTRETMVAAADIPQFTFVTQNGVERNVAITGAGAAADGVVINDPKADNAATVVVFGRVAMDSPGAMTAGDLVASDANGKPVTAGTGDIVLGKVLEDAVAGQVVTIDFYKGGNAAA